MKYTIKVHVLDDIIAFHHDELEEIETLNPEEETEEGKYHEEALDFLDCLSRVQNIEVSTLDDYFNLIKEIRKYASVRFYNDGTFLEVGCE